MKDNDCVKFLQWLLPQVQMRWPGFRKVQRMPFESIDVTTIKSLSSNRTEIRDEREWSKLACYDEQCELKRVKNGKSYWVATRRQVGNATFYFRTIGLAKRRMTSGVR